MIEEPEAAAERIERKSRRIMWASGSAFLAWQFAYFAVFPDPGPRVRMVDVAIGVAFVAWSAALLLLVASGGGAFAGKRVQAILNDELAQARRARAYGNAFWAMMVVALIGYALAHLTPIAPAHLAHLTISAGVLVAVLTFAYLTRR